VERGKVDPGLGRVTEFVRACGFDLDVELRAASDGDAAALTRNLALSPEQRWDKAVAAANFVLAGRAALTRTQ
jgi:hypothetical protein